jgi:hypothetical protein
MAAMTADYLNKLKQRGKDSRVYQKHQLIGLEVAQILHDDKHKSLYIKLAKQHGGDRLMQLAKEVAERRGIKNMGAYFMRVIGAEPQARPRAARQK